MMMVGGFIVFFLMAQVSLQSRLRTHTKIPTDNSQCLCKTEFLQTREKCNQGLEVLLDY